VILEFTFIISQARRFTAMETSKKLDLLLKSVDSLREAHQEMSTKFQRLEKEVAAGQEETAQLIVHKMRKEPEPTFR